MEDSIGLFDDIECWLVFFVRQDDGWVGLMLDMSGICCCLKRCEVILVVFGSGDDVYIIVVIGIDEYDLGEVMFMVDVVVWLMSLEVV